MSPAMIMQKHVTRMSLEEKCAQMVMVDYRFDLPDPERIVRLVKAGAGGVCFFSGNMFELTPLVNSLQTLAKFPLLMSADYENGVAMQVSGATALPTNLAVGASGSEELARLKGKVTAVEALALGVPWVLAPVVDLQSNPLNPIINTRAFGEGPEPVAKLAAAFARGLREGGALSCAKHFPGHGDVAADSHLELPLVDRDEKRLRDEDLKPFFLLKNEVDSVMTAHLRVRAFDAELPASLSKRITTDLLRNEIGFEGLVCTDALMMGGITRVMPEDRALVLAAEAGADALLYPVEPDAAPGILAKAVREGRLPEKRVNDAVERIFIMKEKARLFERRHTNPGRLDEVLRCEGHLEAARRIAEAALTKVRDERSLLPLSGKVGCVVFDDESCRGDLSLFRRELAKHVEVEDGEGSPCVIAVFFKQRAFSGKTGMDEDAAERIREIARRVPETVVISFGSPYVLRQFPDVRAYVCAYSEDEASQRAAARALVGKIPFAGRLPVTL